MGAVGAGNGWCVPTLGVLIQPRMPLYVRAGVVIQRVSSQEGGQAAESVPRRVELWYTALRLVSLETPGSSVFTADSSDIFQQARKVDP